MGKFLKKDEPTIVTMIQAHTAERVFELIEKALAGGTEAFGLQIEQLEHQYRDEKTLREIFAAMKGMPCYVTNYRFGLNDGKTDEELAEELVHIVKCGGVLADVMGDYFCPEAEQLTMDNEAIEKQKILIEKIHSVGGEVLMSSHTLHYMCDERVLHFMNEHKKRGADISKIVTASDTPYELDRNMEITSMLHKEKTLPTLFLTIGDYCRKHRMAGPLICGGMFLCVVEHDELATENQPLLSDVKNILNLMKKTKREVE